MSLADEYQLNAGEAALFGVLRRMLDQTVPAIYLEREKGLSGTRKHAISLRKKLRAENAPYYLTIEYKSAFRLTTDPYVPTPGTREPRKHGSVGNNVAAYALHTRKGMSVRAIARMFDVHPSTPLRQIRKIKAMRGVDATLDKEVDKMVDEYLRNKKGS